MPNRLKLLEIILLFILYSISVGCDTSDNHENLLKGIIYRDISTITAFKGYEFIKGSVTGKEDSLRNYNYGLEHIRGKKNDVVIFCRILNRKDSPNPDYQILDTINVDIINDNVELNWGNCRLDTVVNSEIIALFYYDNEKLFYDRIIKAWKVDFKQERIIPISNTKGIDCINEGDPCPEYSDD